MSQRFRTPLRTAMVVLATFALPPRRAHVEGERTSRGRARGGTRARGRRRAGAPRPGGARRLPDPDHGGAGEDRRERRGRTVRRTGSPRRTRIERIPRATIAFKQVKRAIAAAESIPSTGSARARPRRCVAGARSDHADRSRDRDVHRPRDAELRARDLDGDRPDVRPELQDLGRRRGRRRLSTPDGLAATPAWSPSTTRSRRTRSVPSRSTRTTEPGLRGNR